MRPSDRPREQPTSSPPPEALGRFRRRRLARSVLTLVGLVGFPVWCALAIVVDRMGLRSAPSGAYDAIVVAGCRVLHGGQPSGSLTRRTAEAVQLWRRGVAPVIALTGGVGKWPPSEAEVAANIARRLGVPDSALVLEARSKSTLENARFLRGLVPYERIVVVTDSYHVRRCEWFFRKYFREVRGAAVVSPFWDRAKGAFREVIAYIGYLTTAPWTLTDER